MKRILLLQRIFIGVFFFWHCTVIGAAGISYTITDFGMKTVQQYVYAYGNWYLNGIQQVQHNWGFFGFVPNAIIRFTFDKKVDDMWIPIKEYTQIQSPYFGHHNQFNFFRGMVEDEKNYSEHINRWLLYFCADENIRDTDIQLSKKYAFFPKEEEITNTTWRNWKPYWQSMPVTTIHCP